MRSHKPPHYGGHGDPSLLAIGIDYSVPKIALSQPHNSLRGFDFLSREPMRPKFGLDRVDRRHNSLRRLEIASKPLSDVSKPFSEALHLMRSQAPSLDLELYLELELDLEMHVKPVAACLIR